jgi:hypothetical protein
MMVQGPLERILESVLPHEITHTILASDFRGAVPRWADEGAAVLCEGEQDIVRKQLKVADLLTVQQIPISNLLSLSEYPADGEDLLLVYAQGYSLTKFLVERNGKETFVRFLKDANARGWTPALESAYGFKDVDAFGTSWHDWMQDRASSAPLMAQSAPAPSPGEPLPGGSQGD